MFVAYAWADLDYWAAGSGDRQDQSGNIFTAGKKVASREKAKSTLVNIYQKAEADAMIRWQSRP